MPEFSTMLSLQAQMMLLLACGIILTKKGILIMLTQWQLPAFLGQAVKCTSNCNTAISTVLSLLTTPLWCLMV